MISSSSSRDTLTTVINKSGFASFCYFRLNIINDEMKGKIVSVLILGEEFKSGVCQMLIDKEGYIKYISSECFNMLELDLCSISQKVHIVSLFKSIKDESSIDSLCNNEAEIKFVTQRKDVVNTQKKKGSIKISSESEGMEVCLIKRRSTTRTITLKCKASKLEYGYILRIHKPSIEVCTPLMRTSDEGAINFEFGKTGYFRQLSRQTSIFPNNTHANIPTAQDEIAMLQNKLASKKCIGNHIVLKAYDLELYGIVNSHVLNHNERIQNRIGHSNYIFKILILTAIFCFAIDISGWTYSYSLICNNYFEDSVQQRNVIYNTSHIMLLLFQLNYLILQDMANTKTYTYKGIVDEVNAIMKPLIMQHNDMNYTNYDYTAGKVVTSSIAYGEYIQKVHSLCRSCIHSLP